MFSKYKLLKLSGCVLALVAVISSVFSVSAGEYPNYEKEQPYYSYEYNGYGELSTAPDGYYVQGKIYLAELGIDMTDANLTDFHYDGKNLYLLDGGKGRIIVLDNNYKLIKVIEFTEINNIKYQGESTEFVGASGIYVEADGTILVCDTERERVLFIKDNILTGMIKRPDSTVLSKDIKFDVKKVVKNGGNYYVTAESVISGAMVFNAEYEFIRFFGSNNVAVTSEVLLRTIQSLWMSDAQIAASRKFAASKISGLDVDEHGFIVVTSNDNELTLNGSAVRCINYKGSDITGSDDTFGDREITKSTANKFIDVAVDDANFYVLLDSMYGRIFVYSDKGAMVTAFGGVGTVDGTFTKPVSVETIGENVLVLDSALSCITLFGMTDYAVTKRQLMSVIDSGNYDFIAKLSDDLLKQNTNCQYAFYAKGFVEEANGNYENAMKYYKTANDTASYSQAYKLHRKDVIKENFTVILIAVIIGIAVIIVGLLYLKKGLTKKEGMVYSPLESGKKGYPLYCLFHPADGFSQIKAREVLSPVWAVSIIAVWFYIVVLSFFNTGYIFNSNRASDFNILIIIAKTLGVLALFVIANWAICTLMDGKGKPKEIFYTVVYAMIPYVLSLIINLPLSMFVTSEESIVMSIISTIGVLWSLMVGFVGLLTIHEYSVGKSIFSIILSLLGMAIIILLVVMFFTLMAQTVSFVQSIIQEYSLRH